MAYLHRHLIEALDEGGVEHPGGGAEGLQIAPRQHDQLIGKLGRQVEIVQHHQGDPLLLPGLLAEVLHQLHLVMQVQGADRLVQHHDAGVAQQHLGEQHHLPLAAA
ncbi:hypothetical protein D3C78_1022400 [compost metagenome]